MSNMWDAIYLVTFRTDDKIVLEIHLVGEKTYHQTKKNVIMTEGMR